MSMSERTSEASSRGKQENFLTFLGSEDPSVASVRKPKEHLASSPRDPTETETATPPESSLPNNKGHFITFLGSEEPSLASVRRPKEPAACSQGDRRAPSTSFLDNQKATSISATAIPREPTETSLRSGRETSASSLRSAREPTDTSLRSGRETSASSLRSAREPTETSLRSGRDSSASSLGDRRAPSTSSLDNQKATSVSATAIPRKPTETSLRSGRETSKSSLRFAREPTESSLRSGRETSASSLGDRRAPSTSSLDNEKATSLSATAIPREPTKTSLRSSRETSRSSLRLAREPTETSLRSGRDSSASSLRGAGVPTQTSVRSGSETSASSLRTAGVPTETSLRSGTETSVSSLRSAREPTETSLRSGRETSASSLRSAREPTETSMRSGRETSASSLRSAREPTETSLRSGRETSASSLRSAREPTETSLRSGSETSASSLRTAGVPTETSLRSGRETSASSLRSAGVPTETSLRSGGETSVSSMPSSREPTEISSRNVQETSRTSIPKTSRLDEATEAENEVEEAEKQSETLECCKHPMSLVLAPANDLRISINKGNRNFLLKLNNRKVTDADKEVAIYKSELEAAPQTHNPVKFTLGTDNSELDSLEYDENDRSKSLREITVEDRAKYAISEEFVSQRHVQETFATYYNPMRNISRYTKVGHRPQSKSSHYGVSFGLSPLKVYNYGERDSSTSTKGSPQDFYEIRDMNVDDHKLWKDPEFQANDAVLLRGNYRRRRVVWKRPSELVRNPQLFVDGYSRFDIVQGELGDCWFLAATANLTLTKRMFEWVVPDDQSFDQEYAGVFHFRFWRFGRWVDVPIDDRLPTENGKLIYLHSTEKNEFWSALLEKAYAKLNGSYDILKGGATSEAMVDFSGGVVEMIDIKQSDKHLFQIMLKAYERASLMGCSIDVIGGKVEEQTKEGLLRGHAYSITKVTLLSLKRGGPKEALLRIRNPWGNYLEWNGAWSDDSPEWENITKVEKNKLGLTFEDDGEFWMCFEDFRKHFDRLELCNLNPDSLSDEDVIENGKKRWDMSVYEGEWVKGCTAGGCRNNLNTYWLNPQYRVTLEEPDENDEDGNCTIIVSIMQKKKRMYTGGNWLSIGFAIYYLQNPSKLPKPLNLSFFKTHNVVAKPKGYANLREVSARFKLPPGTYCIVPSTFSPNEEGEFLLRVFSEKENNMVENDQEISQSFTPLSAAAPTDKEKLVPKQIRELFFELSQETEELTWYQLKTIIDQTATKEGLGTFSKDMCRSMIAMVDFDRSGNLCFEEFADLYDALSQWTKVFKKHKKSKAKAMSGYELREALNEAGYQINVKLLNMLMHRYGNMDRELDYEDFINCAIKLKTMIELFQYKKDDDMIGLFIDDWIEYTLYS